MQPEGLQSARDQIIPAQGPWELFYTVKKKGIKLEHADRLERILDRLNSANMIKDMNYPGSNLHKLTGDKKGQYAVKVSGNWRVFFEFSGGNAYVVNYDDYHWKVQSWKEWEGDLHTLGKLLKKII